METNTLILLRGLPGSGKSMFARMMWPEAVICEADQYFTIFDKESKFNPGKLSAAHDWCKTIATHLMSNGKKHVVVANTFTMEKEIEPYLELAEKYGYRVVSLIVENRHGNPSVNNVQEKTMNKMKTRFSVKLV